MINSYGDYMIVGVIKAFWSNKGVTQPQVSPTAQKIATQRLRPVLLRRGTKTCQFVPEGGRKIIVHNENHVSPL